MSEVVRLPDLEGLIWRPLTVADAPAMSALQQTCFAVDGGYRLTPQEMAEEFDRHGDHVETDSIGAFTEGGAVEAVGWCQAASTAESEHRFFVFLYVHPDRRGVGLEDALLAWIEDRALDRFAETDDDLAGALYRYEVYQSMTEDHALMERQGYAPARYFTENARPLDEAIPDVALPEPLEQRRWSDDVSMDALAVHNAAFADHWGSQPTTAAVWRSTENEFFLPNASWVVYDGAEPVAYVKCAKYPHDFDDRGRRESWIEGVGTVRSHRGRGIASALITLAMRAFADDGMEYACLGVDADSPTGANRLYERLGFVPEKRWIAYRKPLARAGLDAGGPLQ